MLLRRNTAKSSCRLLTRPENKHRLLLFHQSFVPAEYPIIRRMASSLTSHFQGGQQKLPPVADREKKSDRVFQVLGLNPGSFSLNGTNTYLVGTGPKKILIDCAEGRAEYVPNLEKAMEMCGCKEIQEIIMTHWHFDHLGGVP